MRCSSRPGTGNRAVPPDTPTASCFARDTRPTARRRCEAPTTLPLAARLLTTGPARVGDPAVGPIRGMTGAGAGRTSSCQARRPRPSAIALNRGSYEVVAVDQGPDAPRMAVWTVAGPADLASRTYRSSGRRVHRHARVPAGHMGCSRHLGSRDRPGVDGAMTTTTGLREPRVPAAARRRRWSRRGREARRYGNPAGDSAGRWMRARGT